MEKYHLKKEYYSFHKLKGLGHNFQPCGHDRSEWSDEFHK